MENRDRLSSARRGEGIRKEDEKKKERKWEYRKDSEVEETGKKRGKKEMKLLINCVGGNGIPKGLYENY